MKRMHVHLGVDDLDKNIEFYSALFNAKPVKIKEDYAKWILSDPLLNFAISTRPSKKGLNHFGLQVETEKELEAIRGQLSAANISTHDDGETTCCYARSKKSWVTDSNGIAWEAYRTMEDVNIFSDS